jgi:hypothetical protein
MQMLETYRSHGRLAGLVAATATALLGAAGIVWAWNTLGPDLFGAPAIAYRHGLAVEFGVFLAAAIVSFGVRFAAGATKTAPPS